MHQVSDKQATIKTQEAEYRIPTDVDSSHQRAQRRLISAHQIPADDQQVSVKTMHWYPIETDHTLTNTIDTVHRTNWDSSHQPQIVPTKQEIVQTCEIKHQTPDNTDKQVTPQVAESKQQVLTKTHKIEYHSSSDFPQIQENIHQPLHETQLQSQEVAENKQQVMIKAVPEQPQAQIQYMLLKSQQVSIKRETSSQPSLEAQLLQVPNQNAYEPLVKIDEATHEIQHIVTEDEEQGYTLTEPRHLMQQTLTDTQVSVGTQQITKPTSYLPQVKQSSTVDPSKIPNESQLNIQISSQKVLLDKEIKDVQEISNESEENKCHVAVIAQPTQIVCDQAAFQTPGEASDDEIMDQTQHVPMKTIETVHQYPNTEKTSTDKPTVVDTKQEISQVSNEDRNTVFLLETQEVSHLLVEDITPTETRQMPQAEDQHSLTGPQQTLQQTDVRSGDTCNTEGKQQLLNKNSDEFRVTHCILNENANQPIKIHRMPPDVDQTLVKTLEEVSDDEIIDQTQHVLMENKETLHQYPKTEEVSTEISQIPNEGRNTALLFETQKLSHLLVEDITPTETGQMPQAKVQQILQNSQQVSTEKETPLQTSLGAQVPNQNAREPLVKLDEAKEVTHEIQHIVTEDEEQDYTLTEPRHVMQQTLTDTQVSVGAQQNTEPILYLPQVKQSSTVDPLKIPNESQLNTQISSQRILDNELKTIQDVSNQLEEESKYQVTVIDQQTPSVSDQAAFQTPGEASDDDDEIMDQTQHVPMKTIETVHQYPNTEKTSTDKPTVVDTKQEISQVPNDDINMVLLLETQKVSHILVEDITPTETRLIPQAEDQHSLTGPQRTLQETDARSGDIHNTETTQQLLNKDSDEFQITHCILNENVNQPIKIPPQTLQEVTQHLSLDTEHCEQTVVELQPRLHNQHMVEVSHQFIDDNDTVVMMETHHCIKSIDAPVMSHDASATHQRGILQATQQTSHDQVLHQTQLDCEHISHQCSSETQQTPDSSPTQPVVHSSPHNTEQTSAVTDQPVQIDEHPCVEVEMSHTSNEFGKVSNQQSLKTTQELNKPQSATIHEVLINTTATSVHHVAQHPPNEACRVSIESEQMSQEASVVETYHTLNEPQMKFSKTQESSDKVAKQIIHQLVESDNAHITTNIQGSSHNGVKDDQRSLTIHSTLDRVYTTVCQLPPMSVLEPQKTSQQQHLQSISLEKSEQLQTEASLDEANEHIDQPVTLETQQEISPSSQQALFESTKGTYHNLLETQPTLNLIEPSQLLIDVQEQTQQIQSQQISYQLPEGAEEYQKPFETECTSIKTPEMLIQIPVGGTTPQSPPETMCSHSDDNRQEVSSDSHQEIISTEPQEVPLLRINDDTKEVTDVPTKTKGVEHCFTFNNNQTPNKVPPFSVEIHKLSIEDDCISYQPLPKTQPVLKEAHLETCSLLMEQRSVLHEISIDYREKMVETRKTFYRTSTLDDPHTFEHLFSIEAKQPLPEQLQPQQISPKTKEITHRVLDEPRSTLAESGHLEKEQILVEPQPNPLVSNNKEVVRTVEISAEDKTQQIPIDTVTTQKLVERSPEAKKHINPVVVEYDEDVMIIEFTNGDQVTKHNFVIVPSYHVSHHYHLYADEYITPIGKEISTCTIRCCSYHILVKIEKVSQKKKPYAVPVSTPWHQNDLQSTRKAIDELLLKYL